MKEQNTKPQNIIFTEEEEKLLKIYYEEYNEAYPKILLLNPFEFFQNIIKGLELTLKDKLNGFPSSSKSKIEDYLLEKVYPSDYKFALFVKKNIKNRTKDEICSHYFKGEILAHCEYDKYNDFYIHTCGEKFQYFKYKISNNNLINFRNKIDKNSINSNSSQEKNKAQYDICLFCDKCEMIYKSNFIKFKCKKTEEDFYSKILDNNNLDSHPSATWKKYHCNVVINDKMKCQACNNKLYFLSPKKVLCKNCNKEFNPLEIKYKCIICKELFSSEAKIFNSLEYKALKICIKEAIISKIKAKPKKLGCGCKSDINKVKFFHRNHCKGELFLGELNNKQVVICNKCDSVGIYENYIWTCPICSKKFTDNLGKDEIASKEKNINDSPIRKENNNPKSMLFKNLIKNEKMNINNKENIDINTGIKKITKSQSNIKSKYNFVLKLLEKNSKNSYINSEIFSKLDNNNIIKMIEKDENNNFTNIKQRKELLLNSKLINYTPRIANKFDTTLIKQIPKGNYKIDSKDELIEAKNLGNLFQKSSDKNLEEDIKSSKNENISSDISKNNILKIKKEIDSREVKYKTKNDLYNDISREKINNNLVNNSKDEKSINKYNEGPIRRLFTKIKYNNSFNKECGETELIRIIRNIRQNKEIKSSRKNSANNSGKNSIEKDHSQIKKQLSHFYKKRDINTINIEPETNKIDMLKDFNVAEYKIMKQIGQGSFGQIFMVEDKYKNKYALKKIIAVSDKDIKSIKKEYQILFDIQSKLNEGNNKINIVNIYGLSTKKLDPTTYAMYVLMELGNNDWEKEILERQKIGKYYTEEELMNILYALISTLEKLQKENISHRDIKPQNILIIKNNISQNYKLTDFGEAKELLSGNKSTEKQTLRGTELYMSPLLFYGLRSRKIKKYIKHNPYKSDVFSLGLCTLFASTLCYESLYDVRELQNNISIKIIIEKYLNKRYSYKIINIISSMLDINETTRDDFIELKKRIDNM